MPFTIQDILTLKIWRWRVWGFFTCYQLVYRIRLES